jgi:hypothetical protein
LEHSNKAEDSLPCKLARAREPHSTTQVFGLTMNLLLHPKGAAPQTDLRWLHGKIVLVKSTRDPRNPPTAMRGTVEIRPNLDAPQDVSIVVEFPQMFHSRAHHRTLRLDHAAICRLLASENNGAFEFTIDDELS